MPKKTTHKKYLEAASLDAIAAADLKAKTICAAKRKSRAKKIEVVIPTVVRCVGLGKSSRRIAAIVRDLHGLCISKDTVLRFARTLPAARTNR